MSLESFTPYTVYRRAHKVPQGNVLLEIFNKLTKDCVPWDMEAYEEDEEAIIEGFNVSLDGFYLENIVNKRLLYERGLTAQINATEASVALCVAVGIDPIDQSAQTIFYAEVGAPLWIPDPNVLDELELPATTPIYEDRFGLGIRQLNPRITSPEGSLDDLSSSVRTVLKTNTVMISSKYQELRPVFPSWRC